MRCIVPVVVFLLCGPGLSLTAASREPLSPGLPAPEYVAAPPADAQQTESGLATLVVTKGTGHTRPSKDTRVQVHYTGWTTDGAMFDSSRQRGDPVVFGLNAVIPGFAETLALMVVGETRIAWIPEELAYQGKPGRPQGMLVFEIEMFDILESPPVPRDVGAIPDDASVTASGLATRIVRRGHGIRRPGPSSKVEVHYSGWTTDGALFDSSVTRGKSATFPLDAVIAGWQEGVQLMVEGEVRRLWIPSELAYGGRSGAPQGMLVFDVELLKIIEP